MKTVSVVRHAKSSWEFPEIPDCERPLLPKGVKRTLALCGYLEEHQLIPDLLVSSTAVRAYETALLVRDALKLKSPIEKNQLFYPGFAPDILEELRKTPNEVNHIMIFGHNPSVTDLVNRLAGKEVTEWLPTSGLITFQLDINQWNEVTETKGKILHKVYPKKLLKP